MAGESILFIEDNPVNMELTADLLASAGYIVLQAVTAEEGIAIAQDHSPDLILMDISLPGMDGLSATSLLKSDPRTRHIPVVALTAHAMIGDEAKARAAGCLGYITKPIDTRTFAQAIEEFFDMARGRD
jgi:CheY-like chemotaxis protein